MFKGKSATVGMAHKEEKSELKYLFLFVCGTRDVCVCVCWCILYHKQKHRLCVRTLAVQAGI